MKKILVVASIAMLWASGVYAAGTAAGSSIDNNATLTYSVGGVTQTPSIVSNTDTFVVDKKIDFTLTNDDGDQKVVVPGAQNQSTYWTLKNTGNADQNFTLASANLTGGESIYGHADTKDTGAQKIYYSTDGGSSWSEYNSAILIAHDANISIRVDSNIPSDLSDGDIANIKLTAKAVKADGTTTETATSGADNKTSVDTVLAEADHTSDSGDESNTNYNAVTIRFGGYKVVTAKLDLTKTSCVYDDPVNGTSNPKRIPGATIIYMFDINNTGSADANDITITDTLVNKLDGNTVTNVKTDENATTTPCACSDGHHYTVGGTAGTTSNSGSGQNVKVEHINVGAGHHTCVSFEVDIK